MYILSEKKQDINCYNISSENLCYNTKKKDLYLNEIQINVKSEVCGYFFSDKYFTFSNNEDYTNSLLNLKTNEVSNLGSISLQVLISGGNFLAIEKINGIRKLIKFDIFNREKRILVDSFSYGIKFTNEKITILNVGWSILKSLFLETGDYQWEINLSQEGNQDERIRQIIGISKDILIVFMANGTLIGIDVNSGQIQWKIPFSYSYYPSDYQGDKWCWHLEDGYLYLLQHRYFIRISVLTQKIEVLWTAPDDIDIEHCSYSEEYIYFMAIDRKVSLIQPCILGVFDRKALKITWQYDKPIGSSHPPQSDGKKLYCLDNEGTLHIFERESEG